MSQYGIYRFCSLLVDAVYFGSDIETEDYIPSWSADTLTSLRAHLYSETPHLLQTDPITEIAIVGASVSQKGFLNQRDSGYIQQFFKQIALSGMRVSDRVRITNYVFPENDVFDRTHQADALLLCNINTTQSENDSEAPLFSNHPDFNPHQPGSFFFHVSPKSIDNNSWANMADKLKVRIVGTFGYSRSVSMNDFLRPASTHSPGNDEPNMVLAEWEFVPGPAPSYSDGTGRLRFGMTTLFLDKLNANNETNNAFAPGSCIPHILRRCRQKNISQLPSRPPLYVPTVFEEDCGFCPS